MQKPVKGITVHQDTDETKVIGILSAVILVLTILTIGSYADNQVQVTEQQVISEKPPNTEQEKTPYLINTSNTPNKLANKERLRM